MFHHDIFCMVLIMSHVLSTNVPNYVIVVGVNNREKDIDVLERAQRGTTKIITVSNRGKLIM